MHREGTLCSSYMMVHSLILGGIDKPINVERSCNRKKSNYVHFIHKIERENIKNASDFNKDGPNASGNYAHAKLMK